MSQELQFVQSLILVGANVILDARKWSVDSVRSLLLSAKGEHPDWSEHVGGEIEDRGYGMKGLIDAPLIAHGAGKGRWRGFLMHPAPHQRHIH